MNHKGMTLLELIITIAILSILTGISTPLLTATIHRNRADAIALLLYNTYQTARSEAITRGQKIHLCGSNNGAECSRDWANQLIVFNDNNQNNQPEQEEILNTITFNLDSGFIRSRLALGRKSITFSATGNINYTGSFVYCADTDRTILRRISWNKAGRIYHGTDNDNDGIVDNTDGTPLNCS